MQFGEKDLWLYQLQDDLVQLYAVQRVYVCTNVYSILVMNTLLDFLTVT